MSKNARRGLTAEERNLWDRVAASVKRRRAVAPVAAKPDTRPQMSRTPPRPPPVPHRQLAAASLQDRSAEKRVRRGAIDVGATLDLHGYTQDAAHIALKRFLLRAHRRGDRVVIVVTGVGRGGEGVLKRMFPGWLAEPDTRQLLSGYARAHRSHGGAGAFYVFLKRQRTERA